MKAFGLHVIVYDPYISEELCQQADVKKVDFDTLAKQSDYISIHCPLTDDTHHLFSKDVFVKMKKTAVLVNTARGAIVDEQALIEALNNKIISGAALDVFEEEPVSTDNRLLHMDNVIVTPHCAWYSEEAISTLQKKVAMEVVNVLQGNHPFNLCNKEIVQ